jgi:hypothetical protein
LLQMPQLEPLAFCEDFVVRVLRHEAWWHGEVVGRPLFLASANAAPQRPISRRMELLDRPAEWLAAKLNDMQQLHRPGDMLPSVRADLGPVLLGSLLGGERLFEADTAWTLSFIDDAWSNVDWLLRADNPWWQRMVDLMEAVAADAAGRYVVMSPGLGGTSEVLLNMRGAGGLSLDVIDRPDTIVQAVQSIFPAWQRAFHQLYAIASANGAWLIHWLNLWSSCRYLVAESDFAYMISRPAFESLFLPDLARQAADVGRAVYHLDGPAATRHLDALLDVPAIRAVQYSPGAGSPSALAWVPMLHKIQERGKSLLIHCPAGEVLALCDALQPEGLAIYVDTVLSVDQLDALYEAFCRRYGTAS